MQFCKNLSFRFITSYIFCKDLFIKNRTKHISNTLVSWVRFTWKTKTVSGHIWKTYPKEKFSSKYPILDFPDLFINIRFMIARVQNNCIHIHVLKENSHKLSSKQHPKWYCSHQSIRMVNITVIYFSTLTLYCHNLLSIK